MKYSKEFHEYWKQLCNAIEVPTARFPTLDTVETLLTEIERLQEVETHLTKNIHVLMQLNDQLQSERRWIPFSEQRPPVSGEDYVARVYKGLSYWYPLPLPPEVDE